MGIKRCPLCAKEVDDTQVDLCEDAERWVVEAIRRSHPGWVKEDGSCPECLAYYKKLGAQEKG